MTHIIDLVKESRSHPYPRESYQDEYQYLLYNIIGNSLLFGKKSWDKMQEKRNQILNQVKVPVDQNEKVEEKITGDNRGITGENNSGSLEEYVCCLTKGINFYTTFFKIA